MAQSDARDPTMARKLIHHQDIVLGNNQRAMIKLPAENARQEFGCVSCKCNNNHLCIPRALFNPTAFLGGGAQNPHSLAPDGCRTIFGPDMLMRGAAPVPKFFHNGQMRLA